MTNLERYNQLFVRDLKIKEEALSGLKYRGTQLWDSLGH
ncbi:acyl carrier protein, partial [Lachnotalea glycerini]